MTPIELNFHFGDNAGYKVGEFAGKTFVGISLSLPIRLTNVTVDAPILIIRTSAIETNTPWQAHRVLFDGSFIGILRDKSGVPNEIHELVIPNELIAVDKPHTLTIEVGAMHPGLLDDFVLKEIELTGGELVLGWVG